jgi:hypothetical protein
MLRGLARVWQGAERREAERSGVQRSGDRFVFEAGHGEDGLWERNKKRTQGLSGPT